MYQTNNFLNKSQNVISTQNNQRVDISLKLRGEWSHFFYGAEFSKKENTFEQLGLIDALVLNRHLLAVGEG